MEGQGKEKGWRRMNEWIKKELAEYTNDWTKWTSRWIHEQINYHNGCTYEWMNKRMKQWNNERMKEWKNERMKEWKNERMKEWKNERMKEWKNERMNEQNNEQTGK